MRFPKKDIEKQKEKELENIFFQLIADIKDSQEAQRVFSNLLTKGEIVVIAKKLAVAKALKENVSYSQIRKNLKVSSATISQTAKLLKKGGLNLALKKVEAEEWAEKWASRIKNLFG